MKRTIALAAVALLAFVPFVAPQAPKIDPPVIQPAEGGQFPTGAIRTSFPKIIESIKSGKSGVYRATVPPPQVITVPKRLSYWGNNQYGMCVTTESIFAIADYSTALGIEEIFVTDANAIAWARARNYLNGAQLLEVMEDMQRDGVKDEKGTLRKTGKPSTVDFSNEDTLKSAIANGPVSIAIDAGALPSGAGNKSGWSAFGGRSHPNTNHCVSLHGYGPTSELFKALGLIAPANAPANGYYLFTWSTVGVVDHAWLMQTCAEAWVRSPTVVDLGPAPPPPPVPGTVTVAVSNVTGAAGVPVKIAPTATGGVSPYVFLTEWGDGAQDASNQHSYKANGSYTVTVTAVDIKGQIGSGTCIAAIGTTPTPPPGPPGGVGTISLNLDGTTRSFELFPIGSRDALKKAQDIIAPSVP